MHDIRTHIPFRYGDLTIDQLALHPSLGNALAQALEIDLIVEEADVHGHGVLHGRFPVGQVFKHTFQQVGIGYQLLRNLNQRARVVDVEQQHGLDTCLRTALVGHREHHLIALALPSAYAISKAVIALIGRQFHLILGSRHVEHHLDNGLVGRRNGHHVAGIHTDGLARIVVFRHKTGVGSLTQQSRHAFANPHFCHVLGIPIALIGCNPGVTSVNHHAHLKAVALTQFALLAAGIELVQQAIGILLGVVDELDFAGIVNIQANASEARQLRTVAHGENVTVVVEAHILAEGELQTNAQLVERTLDPAIGHTTEKSLHIDIAATQGHLYNLGYRQLTLTIIIDAFQRHRLHGQAGGNCDRLRTLANVQARIGGIDLISVVIQIAGSNHGLCIGCKALQVFIIAHGEGSHVLAVATQAGQIVLVVIGIIAQELYGEMGYSSLERALCPGIGHQGNKTLHVNGVSIEAHLDRAAHLLLRTCNKAHTCKRHFSRSDSFRQMGYAQFLHIQGKLRFPLCTPGKLLIVSPVSTQGGHIRRAFQRDGLLILRQRVGH